MPLFLTFLRSEQIGVVSSCQCFYNGPLMIIKVVTPNTSIQPTFSVYTSPLSFYIKTEHISAAFDAACQILEDQNSGLLPAAPPWHVKTIQMVPLLKALKLIKGSFIQFCDVGLRCWPSEFSDLVLSFHPVTVTIRGHTFHNITLFSFLQPYLYFLSYQLSLMPSPKSREWVQRLLFSKI